MGPNACTPVACYVKNLTASQEMVVRPTNNLQIRLGVAMPEVLASPQNGQFMTYVANPGSVPLKLYKDTSLGTAELLSPDDLVIEAVEPSNKNPMGTQILHQLQADSAPQKLPESTAALSEKIDSLFSFAEVELEPEQLALLKLFLYKNLDVFTFTELDLGRSTAVKFWIDSGDAQPVCQRPYRVPESQ